MLYFSWTVRRGQLSKEKKEKDEKKKSEKTKIKKMAKK